MRLIHPPPFQIPNIVEFSVIMSALTNDVTGDLAWTNIWALVLATRKETAGLLAIADQPVLCTTTVCGARLLALWEAAS